MENCDIVFHLASATVPQTSNNNPKYDVEKNVLGTLQILDAMKKNRVNRIVFSSSGGTVYGIPKKLPITEDHPTDPICSYGITKLMIEKYLHLYHTLYGIDYRILRISNAYGERQPLTETQGLIANIFGKIIENKDITIWGDGSIVRDYLYISDIVNAFIAGAQYSGNQKIFNIGGGKGFSVNDLLNKIQKIVCKPFEINYVEGRSFDAPINVLDITAAKLHLNWEPLIEIDEGLTKVYKYMLKEKLTN